MISLSLFAASCSARAIQIIPTWYQYLPGRTDETGRCAVQFTFPDSIGLILLAIVDIMLRIGALLAVGYVVYGGFQYIISQGEPDKTKGAQLTIRNAIIGLVICILATAVVTFIGSQFIR